jgi:hypothetical protein
MKFDDEPARRAKDRGKLQRPGWPLDLRTNRETAKEKTHGDA